MIHSFDSITQTDICNHECEHAQFAYSFLLMCISWRDADMVVYYDK